MTADNHDDHDDHDVRDFSEFYRLTKDSPPWPLLTRAAALAPDRPGGRRALVLGAGAGRDTRELLAQGFWVTAVDAQPQSVALLAALPNDLRERLRIAQSSFEDFAFDGAPYDLISAQYALPFTHPRQFASVFARLKAALAAGGLFAGQFFGDHDEWSASRPGMTFHTRAAAQDLLRDLETLEFNEEDEDSHTADGTPKHWHVFHILARKPASA